MNNQTDEALTLACEEIAKLVDGWALGDTMVVLVIFMTTLWSRAGLDFTAAKRILVENIDIAKENLDK